MLIRQDVPAEQAGGVDENSNGNGSLMRILPVASRFVNEMPERLLEFVHRALASPVADDSLH
jgi:ADP-ribosylglycohydrolase